MTDRAATTTTVLLVAGLALAGCGGTTQPSAMAPAHAAAAPEPHGKLTAGEYRTLSVALTAVERMGKAKPRVQLRRMASVCGRLDAPRTALIRAARADCRGTVALAQALVAFKPRAAYCKRTSTPGDPTCFTEIFDHIKRLAGTEVSASRASNAQLAGRGIGGRCAAVIGTSPREVAALGALRNASADAASALSSLDKPDYLLALGRLKDALNALDRYDFKGSQRRAVHSCPHV